MIEAPDLPRGAAPGIDPCLVGEDGEQPSVARVEVAPGSTATAQLTIRNTGSVVDEFRVDILGPAAAWTTISRVTVTDP